VARARRDSVRGDDDVRRARDYLIVEVVGPSGEILTHIGPTEFTPLDERARYYRLVIESAGLVW
jgi:hypothetical protein